MARAQLPDGVTRTGECRQGRGLGAISRIITAWRDVQHAGGRGEQRQFRAVLSTVASGQPLRHTLRFCNAAPGLVAAVLRSGVIFVKTLPDHNGLVRRRRGPGRASSAECADMRRGRGVVRDRK